MLQPMYILLMDLVQTFHPHDLDPLIEESGMRSIVILVISKHVDCRLVYWIIAMESFRRVLTRAHSPGPSGHCDLAFPSPSLHFRGAIC